MKRLGIVFSGVPHSIQQLNEYAKLVDKMNFDSIWVAEDYFLRDAITPLASFSMVTDRIKLGTGIINPYTRDPVLIALTIATLDEASNGRAILGLGAGVPSVIKQMMDQHKPLKMMRESVHVIRELLKQNAVTYNGEMIKLDSVFFGECPYLKQYGYFKPIRENIPIHIASMGPKMLQMAGEIGDGVLIALGFSVGHTRQALENVRKGAEKVGKKLEDLDIAAFIGFTPSKDGEANHSTKELIASIISQFFSEDELKLGGFEDKEIIKIKEEYKKRGYKETAKHITTEMANRLVATGNPEKCLEKLYEFEKIGVMPIIFPIGADDVKMAINVASEYLT